MGTIVLNANGNVIQVGGVLSLETLNIVLAIRELGVDYLLPEAMLNKLFMDDNPSYFSIVSGLFYVQNETCFTRLRKSIIKEANAKLIDLSDIRMNSEKAYLLLDLLNCPYVPRKRKVAWLNRVFKVLEIKQPSKTDLQAFLDEVKAEPIHVDWGEVDLLISLEKKELKKAY